MVWDGAIPGFGVRVNPQGTRTFVLKYRLPSGRVRWKTIGRSDKVTLEQARKRAKRDVGLVADGKDPQQHLDVAKDALTLGKVADRFLESHVEARRKDSTHRLYRLVIDGHLRPQLGNVPIADVTTEQILKLHAKLKATPYMANRVVAVASKLFNWAAQAGFRGGPGPHVNPALGIEKYRERARKRYLTKQELARVGCALRVAERRGAMSPAAIAAIKLLLLTGARMSEILSLKWKYVDSGRGLIHLPDSKTGAKVIMLNMPARDILKACPKWADSPYAFPGEGRGKRKGQHRVNLTDAWGWVRKRAKIPDVRIHDLRHSYASVAVSGGQTLPMVGALLGHTQAATTQRYAHLMDDPLRAASDATGTRIAAAITRRPK